MERPTLDFGDELTAVHARLSGILLTEQTMETALPLITSLARDTLAGSVGSGVTLLTRGGKPTTSSSTDPVVDTMDRLQYGLDEGPCLTAWATSSVVRCDDLTTEERWPIWSPQAARLGMRSVLSSSLDAGGKTWGAIKVYSERPHSYDEAAEDVLRRFAAQAAIFVSNVHTAQSIEQLSADTRETLRSRDNIATATGIVMSRRSLDRQSAHRHLMHLAQQSRLPLSELAQRMVTTRPVADSDR